MAPSHTKEIKTMIYNKDGNLGIAIDDSMMVTSVDKESIANGKIELGDRILTLEGDYIGSVEQFNKIVKEKAGNTLKISFLHNKYISRLLKDNQNPSPGYEIKDAILVWNQGSGQKLGLNVKNDLNGNVIVSRVDQESVASMFLCEGDKILQVDGWPVTEKELCKRLMIIGFRQNNRVQLKVERAVDDKTRTEVSKCLTAVTDQEPSVLMNSDVLDILKRQKERMKDTNVVPESKKILKKGSECKKKAKPDGPRAEVKMSEPENPLVNIIGKDHSAIINQKPRGEQN
ncbi:unnamed protein product [Bursaphelenchus xylophilus]|uniref:(pine wood nematode) hypothetical protein n=1 Tax=Bursaphelenchus xylophilus TaxID=6326 RepID=A0A1I7RX45_BURXY|nr:unnamed protein product [Bursaphelenchus xylophilus]CAG9121315.1 unnamed protein product [Bursaphelenchus xylophilus]